MNEPWTLDLFAGAGGLSLGFRAMGFRCAGALDYDHAAMRTFAENFSQDGPCLFAGPEDGDIVNLGVEQLKARVESVSSGSPTVVMGGPPCQGFSRIGRAKHASLIEEPELRALLGQPDGGERNQLYRHFLKAVELFQPLAFVMENVPGMRNLGGIDYAGRIAREARHTGYNVRYFLLNAAEYGVPQFRWRLFFVGLRRDLGLKAIPRPPARTHRGAVGLPDGFVNHEDEFMVPWGEVPWSPEPRPLVTVKEALRDLPRLENRSEEEAAPAADAALPLSSAPSAYAVELRQWPGCELFGDEVTDNWYRKTNPRRDPPIFKAMAQGDRYPEAIRIANRRFVEALRKLDEQGGAPEVGTPEYARLLAELVPPYRNDAFADKWHKLKMNAPSWTVTAHLSRDSYSHIHYDSRQARMLTIREAARLQSFPDGVRFLGGNGDRFRQIGNAVPPMLARAVAGKVREQLVELGALDHVAVAQEG